VVARTFESGSLLGIGAGSTGAPVKPEDDDWGRGMTIGGGWRPKCELLDGGSGPLTGRRTPFTHDEIMENHMADAPPLKAFWQPG
jgi:hypothetical protein